MKVKVSVVGVLENVLPSGEDVVEVDAITVQGVLDALVERYGSLAEKELLDSNGLRKGLSALVNGRNALSLPEKFQTSMQDGDEVVITVQVSGG